MKKYLPLKLQRLLKQEDSDVLTVEMLDEVAPGFAALDRLSRKPFIAFFEPPSLDERIINQAALLSVSCRADLSVSHWLYAHKELFHRIVVPARLKQEIRDKLDQANIHERTLFPGLDGLSLWLTRYYSPSETQHLVSRDFRGTSSPSQIRATEPDKTPQVGTMKRRTQKFPRPRRAA